MLSKMISGFTRICGKSQGFAGLPIRDIHLDDGTPCMVSAWEPTPGELRRLLEGEPVLLLIQGTTPPPVKLMVRQEGDLS